MRKPIHPLAEEIGDPDLFVGRRAEMAHLFQWAENTKLRRSRSMGILSRRKKGKTALLQRFFNILYDRNDPQLIPFYYRIPQNVQTKSDFTEAFYRRILTQYFAFTTRSPKWVGQVLAMDELKDLAASDQDLADDIRRTEEMLTRAPTVAWTYAQEAGHRISQVKDVRILQILDEFQYMNKYIVSDDDPERVELLCHSYMGPAESKYSPQIVAGSYIGWLGAILSHLTGRYGEWQLESLSSKEALEAVYNYAAAYKVAVTDETAIYIAEVCGKDPWYIASTIRNRIEEKDLTTADGVREALALETIDGKGEIARIWREYLHYAFPEVNARNARKIVLYLARHDPQERTRKQILQDLELEIGNDELEVRLRKLVKADILAQGSSAFHFRGLGDPIFAMVFRRLYGAELEDMSPAEIVDEFKRQLASLRGKAAQLKGAAAEYRILYRLSVAAQRGATLTDVVVGDVEDDVPLGPFAALRKARFFVDQSQSYEIDVHAVSVDATGTDLMVEVKDLERPASMDAVRRFIAAREAISPQLERRTVFLVYSESGVNDRGAAALADAGILVIDSQKLAAFEAS